MTICQLMLKIWCINLFLFTLLLKKLVHLYCNFSISIWQTQIGLRSNLPLLNICALALPLVMKI